MSVVVPPQVKAGDEFTLAVNMSSPRDVKTLSFDLVYDDNSVEVVKAEQGAYMQQGGDTPKVTQTAGAGRQTFSFARSTSGATGIGAVAQFTLRAKQGGPARFSVENVAAQDATGQPVPILPQQPGVVTITP